MMSRIEGRMIAGAVGCILALWGGIGLTRAEVGVRRALAEPCWTSRLTWNGSPFGQGGRLRRIPSLPHMWCGDALRKRSITIADENWFGLQE